MHQSVKDFLFIKAAREIFLSRIEAAHYAVFLRTIKIISILHRDMYNLRELGYPAELVELPYLDPLAAPCYACTYWIDYLGNSSPTSTVTSPVYLQDGGAVYEFLKGKYLY